jgi:hypothetical protein
MPTTTLTPFTLQFASAPATTSVPQMAQSTYTSVYTTSSGSSGSTSMDDSPMTDTD